MKKFLSFSFLWLLFAFFGYAQNCQQYKWAPKPTKFEAGHVIAGYEAYKPVYIVRASYQGGKHIGKLRSDFTAASIAYGDNEVQVSNYEILVSGDAHFERAIDGKIPANAFVGGNEADGTPLYVARAVYAGGIQVGKVQSGWEAAAISYGGKTIWLSDFEVLVVNTKIPVITASGATTFNQGGSVNLSIDAPDNGLNAWYKNGVEMRIYTKTISVNQSGTYTCMADGNGYKVCAKSNPITVTVNAGGGGTGGGQTPVVTNKTETSANGFRYKTYYQNPANATNRKGIIILAHGDGGTENDGTLNDQCNGLAAEGYVAITTSYRNLDAVPWAQQGIQFKQDLETVITAATAAYGIPRNKVIIGGSSRGGNATFSLILPGQMGNEPPIAGIKGAILQCPGGDTWKGSAVLFPVAYMANAIDPTMGSTSSEFQTGLNRNANATVKALSECLIIPGSGHCGGSAQYKAFIIRKVKQWLP